jgi:hypothetical protein
LTDEEVREMAVAVEMEFAGATLDQYDQVIEKMELEPRGDAPPDCLFHWVAKTDDGIRVVDVWSSREAFDRFADEQIGPFSAEAGIEGPPAISYHELHSYMTTPAG